LKSLQECEKVNYLSNISDSRRVNMSTPEANSSRVINGHDHHVEESAAPKHQSMISQVPNPPFMKLANPGPLGLISFALTTFVLGLYQCGAG
jgi:hypothetical protein